MLRLAEFGLFVLPFGLYVAWVFASKRARPVVFWGALVVLVTLLGCVVWYGLAHSLDKTVQYVPAHVEDGRIVAGHGEAVDPATRPVVPRPNVLRPNVLRPNVLGPGVLGPGVP
jgi:hypothetical protein